MNGNFRVFYTTTEKEFIIFNFQVKEAQLFKLPPLAVHDLAEKVKFTDPLVNTKGYSFSMSDVRVFHDLSRILALFLNPNHKALLEPWRFNDTMTLP